jgi:hypothetical protein
VLTIVQGGDAPKSSPPLASAGTGYGAGVGAKSGLEAGGDAETGSGDETGTRVEDADTDE